MDRKTNVFVKKRTLRCMILQNVENNNSEGSQTTVRSVIEIREWQRNENTENRRGGETATTCIRGFFALMDASVIILDVV